MNIQCVIRATIYISWSPQEILTAMTYAIGLVYTLTSLLQNPGKYFTSKNIKLGNNYDEVYTEV